MLHTGHVIEDFDSCYRAVRSRDPRFDGWFFTAVTSTGIYCRPSCPARTPKPENVRFYPSAAAAQQAGFRACKRCRPDASPGSPEWDGRAERTSGSSQHDQVARMPEPGGPHRPSRALAAWRSYAVQYLWATGDHPINHWPAASNGAELHHPEQGGRMTPVTLSETITTTSIESPVGL